MRSNLDTMTFAPLQQVNAKNLIASRNYRSLMANYGVAETTQELFSNTNVITNQVSLRTVRSVLALAKNPLFIELRNTSCREFVTIAKLSTGVVVNHYKRHCDAVLETQEFYSVSEAILHCCSHGFKHHCDYLTEFNTTKSKANRLNQRAALLSRSIKHS